MVKFTALNLAGCTIQHTQSKMTVVTPISEEHLTRTVYIGEKEIRGFYARKVNLMCLLRQAPTFAETESKEVNVVVLKTSMGTFYSTDPIEKFEKEILNEPGNNVPSR